MALERNEIEFFKSRHKEIIGITAGEGIAVDNKDSRKPKISATGGGGGGGDDTAGVPEIKKWTNTLEVKKGDLISVTQDGKEYIYIAIDDSVGVRPKVLDGFDWEFFTDLKWEDLPIAELNTIIEEGKVYRQLGDEYNNGRVVPPIVIKVKSDYYVRGDEQPLFYTTSPKLDRFTYLDTWDPNTEYFTNLLELPVFEGYEEPIYRESVSAFTKMAKSAVTHNGKIYAFRDMLDIDRYITIAYDEPGLVSPYQKLSEYGGAMSRLTVGKVSDDTVSDWLTNNPVFALGAGPQAPDVNANFTLGVDDDGLLSRLPMRMAMTNEDIENNPSLKILTTKEYVKELIKNGGGGGEGGPANSNLFMTGTDTIYVERAEGDPANFNNKNLIFKPKTALRRMVFNQLFFYQDWHFTIHSLDAYGVQLVFNAGDVADGKVVLIDSTSTVIGVGSLATITITGGKAFISIVNV